MKNLLQCKTVYLKFLLNQLHRHGKKRPDQSTVKNQEQTNFEATFGQSSGERKRRNQDIDLKQTGIYLVNKNIDINNMMSSI